MPWQCMCALYVFTTISVLCYSFLVKQVPGWGLEQRESGKIVLYPLIIIILISYIIIYYYSIINLNENHPSWNRERNSFVTVVKTDWIKIFCFRYSRLLPIFLSEHDSAVSEPSAKAGCQYQNWMNVLPRPWMQPCAGFLICRTHWCSDATTVGRMSERLMTIGPKYFHWKTALPHIDQDAMNTGAQWSIAPIKSKTIHL